MANFASYKPNIGATWHTQYYAYVDAVEAYATQIDTVNTAYGQTNLSASLTQLGTNLNTQMEEYVQSVALTGVDPTEIGSANQVVAINATGNGFAGVSNSDMFDRLKSDIKKAILIYGD